MKSKIYYIAVVALLLPAVFSCSKTESTPPDISLPSTISINESNTGQVAINIPVTLNKAAEEKVSFRWSTQEGTATADVDFVEALNGVLVFEPGESEKSISILINGDEDFEENETFFVTASDAKNGKLIQYRTEVTITNDDILNPILNVASVTKVTEGTLEPVKARVLVILEPELKTTVTVKWATTDGTAKANEDYTPVSDATLVFAPGETQKYIEVPVVNDTELEFNDSLAVDLTEVSGAKIGNGHAKIILTNDDSYTPEIASDGVITPDSYPGMQLVWADEFEGNSINTTWWTHELGGGGWGNNELEVYTNKPENSFVSNGKLNIVATKNYSVYNSARMITKGKKEFIYGRIDIRAKMPVGQGIWPALWTLGGNISQVSWPACGEIDIMEYLGHDITRTYGTVHYNDGGHQYKGGSLQLPAGQGYNQQFHVFSIIWQENSIVWYVDYQKYYEVTNANIKFDAFNKPQFFLFNVAVGGNWPGNPDATTVFPQTMQVDYIRVFQP